MANTAKTMTDATQKHIRYRISSFFGITVGIAVFYVIEVLRVHQAQARLCGTGPNLFYNVVSVQSVGECLSEFVDCKDCIVLVFSAFVKVAKSPNNCIAYVPLSGYQAVYLEYI